MKKKANIKKRMKTNMRFYKVVNVYTGYSENTVENIDIIINKDVKGACYTTIDDLRGVVLRDDEGNYIEDNEDFFEEFYNYGEVISNKDYGRVGGGEENMYYILGESNKFYNKVDDFENWNDNEIEEWDNFLNNSDNDEIEEIKN